MSAHAKSQIAISRCASLVNKPSLIIEILLLLQYLLQVVPASDDERSF